MSTSSNEDPRATLGRKVRRCPLALYRGTLWRGGVEGAMSETHAQDKLKVYYDGACPVCVRDRRYYEKLAGAGRDRVEWVDITGRDQELKKQGIDPGAALRELHVRDPQGRIHRELDAYGLLFSRVLWLKPLAWAVKLPGLRGLLSGGYRRWVKRRLQRDGRWERHQDS